MNVLSLFDGISCGRIALERAGIKVDNYFAAEIDKYAIQISKKNYPDIIHLGDVRTIEINSNSFESNNTIYSRDYTDLYRGVKIDLLLGGSPCQDLSITQSKKRKGLCGEKSSLFWEYVRILNESNPDYFIFENVASMPKKDKEVISKSLGVSPILINSSSFVPQNRERLYWTNIKVKNIPKDCYLNLMEVLETQVELKYWYDKDFTKVDFSKPVCCHLIMKGHDFLKRVMNPMFKSQTLTCCRCGNVQKKVYQSGCVRKLTPIEYERLQGLDDNYTEGVSDSQRYNLVGNAWTVDVIAHILSFIKEEK